MQVLYYNPSESHPVLVTLATPIKKAEEYIKVNSRGMLHKVYIYPVEIHDKLMDHWNRLEAKRKELKAIEGEVYSLLNESSKWRRGL